MSIAHQSIATISSPQFINLQPLDINPYMSKCQIKVLYIGANRNHTFIDKDVATEMAKTLRGAPIVGYYKENKEDFADHGEKVIIDDEGIKFECQTVPYGFVDPSAPIWFQDYEDVNDLGESVTHTYLMTTGYLWTGQFPESSLPVDQGRPQSMQLNSQSVKGHWETSHQNGMDFFIINDAIFEKICILGDDVEPCFQGASVTAPNVSKNFTLDNNFKHTLYSMMQDLKNALNEGGQQMENLENTVVIENETTDSISTEFTQEEKVSELVISEDNENIEDTSAPADYSKKEDDDKKEESQEEEKTTNDEKDSEETSEDGDKEDDKKKTQKYTALEEQLNSLKESYTVLQEQYQELVNFKKEIDNQKKDALIAEFYMLSEEDKAEIIANKEKYTLEEIKAKLSVICFDKKINFSNTESEQEQETITFNLNNNEDNSLPEWVKAVKEQEKLG